MAKKSEKGKTTAEERRRHAEWSRITAALEIQEQSDRGAAILACAILDDTLRLAIESRLYKSETKRLKEQLFEGQGPLATLWSRTVVARSLGLINDKIRNDLDRIRQIRNIFGHRMADGMTEYTFDTPEIAKKCEDLWSPDALDIADSKKRKSPEGPRDRYLDAAQQINAWLVAEIEKGECAIKPFR